MGALAVILARAGSQGVPGKNRAPVAGRPCVLWTIDDARHAASVARIVVSTDDPAIKDICGAEGVEIVDRPEDLAGAQARVDDAARHAVETTDQAGEHDAIVILYANVPVRPADLIDRAAARLRETGCDSVQSYARVGKHHPWWMARVDDRAGVVRPWEGERLNNGVYRRQDLPAAHLPDGGVIALTRRSLVLEIPGVPAGPHAFLGADHRGVTTREGEVIDIDSPIDLAVADAALRAQAPPAETRA